MRITVEIDASALKRIQRITGKKKISPAVSQALNDFLRQHERETFIQRAMSGQTDFSMSNEALEALDTYETR